MKKIISAILIAAMLFSFASCVSADSITPAIYTLDDERFPQLHLREDGNFVFTLDMARSQRYRGTYSVAERILTLECDDGNVFCFNVKRNAVEFNAELSDEIVAETPDIPEIVDGTRFRLAHEYKNS